MIWFWIIVAIALILLGLFIFTQGGQNLGPAICTIGVVILLVLIVSPARAHDHDRPELDGWYPTLRSTGGGPCCDGKDQTHLAGEDWESRDGGYRVRIDGEWLDVPKDAVLTEPNRDGRTLVWIYKTNGRTVVRCFMAGAMG